MALVGLLKRGGHLFHTAVKAHYSPPSRRQCSRAYWAPTFADVKRRSGTLVLGTTDLQMPTISADSRITSTIIEGLDEFGDFILSDNERKLMVISTYIVAGFSGEVFFAKRYLRKFVLMAKHNPELSLQEIYESNERQLSGKKVEKHNSNSFLFIERRELPLTMLTMSIGQTGFEQRMYSRFQAAAIGSGRKPALESIAHMIPEFGTLKFCQERDLHICRSGLNAMVNDEFVGGSLVTIKWDPVNNCWKETSIHMNDLLRDHSQFVDFDTFPDIATVEEGALMIKKAKIHISNGNIPEELKRYHLGRLSTVTKESHESIDHDTSKILDSSDKSKAKAAKGVEVNGFHKIGRQSSAQHISDTISTLGRCARLQTPKTGNFQVLNRERNGLLSVAKGSLNLLNVPRVATPLSHVPSAAPIKFPISPKAKADRKRDIATSSQCPSVRKGPSQAQNCLTSLHKKSFKNQSPVTEIICGTPSNSVETCVQSDGSSSSNQEDNSATSGLDCSMLKDSDLSRVCDAIEDPSKLNDGLGKDKETCLESVPRAKYAQGAVLTIEENNSFVKEHGGPR